MEDSLSDSGEPAPKPHLDRRSFLVALAVGTAAAGCSPSDSSSDSETTGQPSDSGAVPPTEPTRPPDPTTSSVPPTSITEDPLTRTQLPGIPGSDESFEPHVVIDPNDPDHILVAAMYGSRFARAARYIYQWTTSDGGVSWAGDIVPAARFSGLFAADPVVAIGPDGTEYVNSLFGNTVVADSLEDVEADIAPSASVLDGDTGGPQGGVAVAASARSAAVGSAFRQNVVVSGEGPSSVNSDKNWIAIDTGSASPFQGAIYVAWTSASNGDVPRETIVFSSSTDGGATYSEPRVISPNGFGVQLAVRPNGQLDVVSIDLVDQSINHMFSIDGGASFSEPQMITTATEGVRRDLPSIAVDPSGRLLACWLHSTESSGPHTRCATEIDGAWSSEVLLQPDVADDTLIVFPAAAASSDGLWVLAYRVDVKTEVILFRSTDGGQSFAQYEVLDSRNIPRANFCGGVAHDTDCRYDFSSIQFVPGDYIGLSATEGRVAAAYVLPADDVADGFATTRVSVLDVGK
jgi:hypothetical protein